MDKEFYKNYVGFKEASPQEIRSVLTSGGGQKRTYSLFEETINPSVRGSGLSPLYTLKPYDYKGLPSAYQIYINSIDETDAALKLVGSITHWERLISTSIFVKGDNKCNFSGINQWRREMALRNITRIKAVLEVQAKKGSVPAAKELYKISRDSFLDSISLSDNKKEKSTKSKVNNKPLNNNSDEEEDENVINFLDRIKNDKKG